MDKHGFKKYRMSNLKFFSFHVSKFIDTVLKNVNIY